MKCNEENKIDYTTDICNGVETATTQRRYLEYFQCKSLNSILATKSDSTVLLRVGVFNSFSAIVSMSLAVTTVSTTHGAPHDGRYILTNTVPNQKLKTEIKTTQTGADKPHFLKKYFYFSKF